MTELTYEQPLNEKTRSYLRLEYLYEQLNIHLDADHQHNCFYPLFSLCELTERCDFRNDVIKDIDKQLQQLKLWLKNPDVDDGQIEQLIADLCQSRDELQHPGRFGQELKNHRFLTAVRQRFSMPGACCSFDLPQLHFWLARPFEERQQEYRRWIAQFSPLLEAISRLLVLTRGTANFTPQTAISGFYQGMSEHPLELIRVKIADHLNCFPTISGHRSRYAIHFVDFTAHKHTDSNIDFMLAACR